MSEPIQVRSHVSRDLLQTAALFKNEQLVVWEYVSNELQYRDPGVPAVVEVEIDNGAGSIAVTGNGRGMDRRALENEFFVLHGENQDRKKGKGGRGLYGTGKVAGLGIGTLIRVSSVRDGKESIVELSKHAVESASNGSAIPIDPIRIEEPVEAPNGTRIEIEGIKGSMDIQRVRDFVERHLSGWSEPGAQVLINGRACEIREPPIDREIKVTLSEENLERFGDGASLVIKVSKRPLEQEERGVDVFSQGVCLETTLGGLDGKEMAEFLFGELNVPHLYDDDSQPAAFDSTRSMKLNELNPLVKDIYTFLGPHLDEVRRQLVSEKRDRLETEQFKRLEREARKIEDLLNQDFNQFRGQLQQQRAKRQSLGIDRGDADAASSGNVDGFLIPGDEVPADLLDEAGSIGKNQDGGAKQTDGPPRRLNPTLEESAKGPQKGRAGGGSRRSKGRGGFGVEFTNLGMETTRAEYSSENRTIYINLDHPQLANALKGRKVEDPVFKRLAYEVAFAEYAIALAAEMSGQGLVLDPDQAIFEIRATNDRIARAGAPLYEE